MKHTKFCVREDVLAKYDLTASQFFLLMHIAECPENDIEWSTQIQELVDKGCIRLNKEELKGYYINKEHGWDYYLGEIIKESSLDEDTTTKVEAIVDEMRSIFPKGINEATGYSWKGNKTQAIKKLESFMLLHPEVTKDQIIEATKLYWSNIFDNRNRRVLQYYIAKNLNGELVSDLEEMLGLLEDKDILEDMDLDFNNKLIQ